MIGLQLPLSSQITARGSVCGNPWHSRGSNLLLHCGQTK